MAEIADDGPDRYPGTPHPRDRAVLFGHDEAERAFLDAYLQGELHHAWLIGGPEGIGKATFAYRAARFLLAHPDPARAPPPVDLAVSMDHPAARRMSAQAHPDLAVVRRGLRKDGKGFSAEIAVAEVRRALDLFASTSAEGGYRICIVDAADDLNASSANALLKTLEEPPPRCLIFLVCHAPARLLTTIRSRCRRMVLRPLSPDALAMVVPSLGQPWSGVDASALNAAIGDEAGSVHRVLTLLDNDRQAWIGRLRGMLDRMPSLDVAAVQRLAGDVTGRQSDRDFALLGEVMSEWLSRRLHERAGEGAARLAPLAEVWEKNARAAREAEAFNLDRRSLVLSMFGDLAEAVRRSSAS